MISKTVRFTDLSSPAAGVAPLVCPLPALPPSTALVSSSSSSSAAAQPTSVQPRVLVSLSGHALAVFDVHDVKRVASWASHPRTVLAASPAIHTAVPHTQTVIAPIASHIDLPRDRARRTIWTWPADRDTSARTEVVLHDTIHAVLAPSTLPEHFLAVHEKPAVSIVSVSDPTAAPVVVELAVDGDVADNDASLAAQEASKAAAVATAAASSTARAPAGKKSKKSIAAAATAAAAAAASAIPAPSVEPTIVFAETFTHLACTYLLLAVRTRTATAPPTIVICNVDLNGAGINVVWSGPLPLPANGPANPGKWMHLSFHPASRHLSVLYGPEANTVGYVASYTLSLSGVASTSTVPLPSDRTPLRAVSLSNRYIAVLSRRTAPSTSPTDKSRFGIDVYDGRFGTHQSGTLFDADLVELVEPQPALGASLVSGNANNAAADQAFKNVVAQLVAAGEDHVIASLALPAAKRGPSRAILLRCNVATNEPVSLLGVMGRNAADNATTLAPVLAEMPVSDDLGAWSATVNAATATEHAWIRERLPTLTSANAVESEWGVLSRKLVALQNKQNPDISPALVTALIGHMFARPAHYSRRVLESLLAQGKVSAAMFSRPGGLLAELVSPPVPNGKNVARPIAPASTLQLALKHVLDVPEEQLVPLVLRLASALAWYAADADAMVAADPLATTWKAHETAAVLGAVLRYPVTDVFVHAALRADSVSSGAVLQLVQVVAGLLGAPDARFAEPATRWMHYILDAHLTTILLSQPPAAVREQIAAAARIVEQKVKETEIAEQALAPIEWLLRDAQREAERRVASEGDVYIGLDGRERTRKGLTKKEVYAIEVVRL
ncbi:hypothetical protein BC828DRAFT_396404 [Blastocladiella britannica]|nr:hypothetical protein BC828DRAFT_396404 [Blastocladiella britannica]